MVVGSQFLNIVYVTFVLQMVKMPSDLLAEMLSTCSYIEFYHSRTVTSII
jgi:hypothetical protein